MAIAQLSEEHIEFLTGGVFTYAAAASSALVPDIAVVAASFIDPVTNRIRIAVDAVQSETLLALLSATQKVAVVFSDPISLKTFQLKGHDVKVGPTSAHDLPEIEHQIALKNERLAQIDFGEPYGSTYHHCDLQKMVFIHFTITEWYDQTPGPNAGKPVQHSP